MAIGLILGSGLGKVSEMMDNPKVIPYSEIDEALVSTVDGHDGCFICGKLSGKDVVIMRGRLHYYEGYDMKQAVKPIDYMINEMGVDTLIITNAAGSMNPEIEPQSLMVINDHISSFVPSPLIGVDLTEKTGARFHDMSEIYDRELIDKLHEVGEREGIELKDGVYIQVTGPQYESKAEVKMYRMLGADAVGMSTAVEALYANAYNVRICGISCISNMATGISAGKLTHEEVKTNSNMVTDKLNKLIFEFIKEV